MRKLKSVIFVDDYAHINGGAAKIAISTSAYLANNTDIDVYYFSAVGPVCDELKNASFKQIICLDIHDALKNPSKLDASCNYIWNRKSKKEFSKFLQLFDSESTVVHVHTWSKSLSSSIFSVINNYKIKTLITLHDYFVDCPNGGYFNYKRACVCELTPMSLKCLTTNCDSRNYPYKVLRVIKQVIQQRQLFKRPNSISYINISDFSKAQIERRNKKIEVEYFVENPIDIGDRKKIELSEDGFYLYIGRLSEEKGIRLFCEVVNQLKLKAVVIGDGPLKEEMNARYGKNIEFKGWLPKEDIQNYFMRSRCLIFTSIWYETFGLTVLEAISAGVPCLVPDNCSAADFITDEFNGLIYKSGDKVSLVDTIRQMQNIDLANVISNNAFESFDTCRYSMETHLNKLLETYQGVLN